MLQRLETTTEDSNFSLGSKSSIVSPSESRVLSEQSEITLDSDSKLSNSVQFKLLQSPQNSLSKTNDTTSSAHRNFGEVAKQKNDTHPNSPPPSEASINTSTRKDKSGRSVAEQDMFSEHFDVS